ncbi:PTS sugar transporter subunit IIB [Schnuerera sp. xch1]|uniref:PTS sugar transporter subunit IIB n=1 Tax=Schnuerera sp. xch1 TaxID=2874283 RepID=UPI001CBE2427|nr:PTS sugar transporter subunit IIB [Schnuerera sp. xch1]MBZ2175377.1 PTS sugar transporter subunit IIB [Schnuerera sp. xch1]
MKKIYLFCDQAMSTSIIAKKMQEVGDKHNLPIEVKAFSIKNLEKILEEENPNCVLLGPQVRHMLDDTRNRVEKYDIPVGVIDSVDYGMMDGEKVLKKTILLMKNYKKS